MGIQRLTQDLRPYLERCIITHSPVDETRIRIVNLVIDGPSMVYHVYKLLVRSTAWYPEGTIPQPSYALLNTAVHCFLSDLESCGAVT